MGDLSTEPSMEDILSSIKRIIAEEGEGTPVRPRRTVRPATTVEPTSLAPRNDEVLELSDPIPTERPEPTAPTSRPAPAQPQSEPDPILSSATAEASRGALDALSRLVVKPDAPSDGTLEGLVRDMLRPMLREWLDARLPAMVETMVAREIAKITGAPR